jgi:hypothetical protein
MADGWAMPYDLEPEVDEAIADEDFVVEMPDFADYPVWCDFVDDWALAWRPGPDGPWFCKNCGSTDHRFRDQEEV